MQFNFSNLKKNCAASHDLHHSIKVLYFWAVVLGQVVSVLNLFSQNPSSNPTEVYDLNSVIID